MYLLFSRMQQAPKSTADLLICRTAICRWDLHEYKFQILNSLSNSKTSNIIRAWQSTRAHGTEVFFAQRKPLIAVCISCSSKVKKKRKAKAQEAQHSVQRAFHL